MMIGHQGEANSVLSSIVLYKIYSDVRRRASTLWLALLHMLDDGGTLLAGHIAFATLFALFPFLIFLTALAGEFGPKRGQRKPLSILASGPCRKRFGA